MSATASDWPNFAHVLESLVAVLDDLPENAQTFIEEMQERFDEWGDECFVSERQWRWMTTLAEDFAK